jgi:hypothetical protein
VAAAGDTDKLIVNLFTDPKTGHEIDCWAKARNITGQATAFEAAEDIQILYR